MIDLPYQQQLKLTPADPKRLATLAGSMNNNIRLIESTMNVSIFLRHDLCRIQGEKHAVDNTMTLLENLYKRTVSLDTLDPLELKIMINTLAVQPTHEFDIRVRSQHGLVKPRTQNQMAYMQALQSYDLNFGIGPAGTGKTFLAVAMACHALQQEEVDRIILVRPAVEAGEKLGFLPGDLSQKVDPYLRPLFDSLYFMLGSDMVTKLIEKQVIEIAPLAYMRGRTLNNAYIILDESQNATREQMKMFLTRIGFGSKTVITGDPTQIDLPHPRFSGLRHAMEILEGIAGIQFNHFTADDVVRHPLVQKIITAYDAKDDTYR